MERIKKIANSIHPSIRVTVDFPAKHDSNRLPILDSEMWIEEVEVAGTMKHQILYSYYEKEMSSKYLIHKNTAISRSSKMNILVNELLRIMKNTSLRVKQDERDKHVQHFMHKMQLSEYNQEDRVHVYKKAMRIFRENVEGKEVYPHVDKFARLSKMTRQKVQQKKTWFKNGRYKSVFYVDATKDGFLAKECQKILNRCDVPIKVMEKTGESLKRMLTKSNPFRTGNCDDPECPVCLRECGINCRTSDVVYQNYCVHHETCNGKYNGETADIIKERFGEHLDDARLRPESSTMWKHAEEKHNGESVEFKVKILGSCPGDALLRQCMEAVSIRDENPEMNRRAEWGAGNGKQKRKKANNNNNNNRNQKKKKTNNSNNDENRKSNSSNNNNLDDNEDTDSTDQNDNSNNASNSASTTGSTNRRRQLHANRKSNRNLDDNEDANSTNQNDNSSNASNSASATGINTRRRQLRANRKSNSNLDDNEDANSTNQNDNSNNASNSASVTGSTNRRRQLHANRKSNRNLDDNEDATNQNDNSNNASNSAIGTGINTRRRQLRANRKSNSNLDENEDADSTNQNCNSDNASNSVSQTGITNRRRQLRTNRKNSNNSNLDDNEDADSTNQNDNSNSASNSASTTGITNQRRQLRQHNKKREERHSMTSHGIQETFDVNDVK